MTRRSYTLFAPLLCLALLGAAVDAAAATLHALAGGALLQPMTTLAAQFERATGHRLEIRYGTTPQLIALVTGDTGFDLGVLPRDVLQDAAARERFAATAPSDVARAGLGVAVRTGAPRPDIATPAALKHALLDARSIVTIPASATGHALLGVFDELGIGAEMQAKTRAQATPAQIVSTVANGGNGDLAVFLLNVLRAPGLDIVGPFPAGLQREVVFTAALAAGTKQGAAAQAFVAHLQSPAGLAVFAAHGLER